MFFIFNDYFVNNLNYLLEKKRYQLIEGSLLAQKGSVVMLSLVGAAY
jgi:hypothetical protein